jgi:hypothetical protein
MGFRPARRELVFMPQSSLSRLQDNLEVPRR